MTTTCPLCGFEYEPGGEACRASGCPLSSQSCRQLHCPRCGYAVPDESASAVARWVRRLFPARQDVPAPEQGDALRLVDMPAGTRVTVERVEGPPVLMAQLTAQGLVAGTTLELKQRHPGFVVEIGETSLAMERSVASGIVVRPGTPLA
jgi:Fe2+ transport system protein FeoA